MTILDLLIIYFACGSPFGVYQLTRDDGARSGYEKWRAAAAFLFWPALFAKFVYERVASRGISTRDRVEKIKAELERLAFSDGETASIFEFREAFDRYVGLSESLSQDGTTRYPITELLSVSGRELDEATTECLYRRNHKKLKFHLTIARNEFLDLVGHAASHETTGMSAAALWAELADLVGDIEAKDQLAEVSVASPDAERSHKERPWKPHISSASNIG